MGNAISQSYFPQNAPLTEKNCPDQSNPRRVHLVTGGYGGVGYELSLILYRAGATVWIAGRSESKGNDALSSIKAAAPDSKGSLHFLKVDLSDLPTIAPAAKEFLTHSNGVLHVLHNNAGVMIPPSGSISAQGHELQMATNCLGPFLLTKLLTPALRNTAKGEAAKGNPEGGVRVTWAGSLGIEFSPSGGIAFPPAKEGGAEPVAPKVSLQGWSYTQSKAGNLFLAIELARREREESALDWESEVRHVAFNPGNLSSGLQRHAGYVESFMLFFMSLRPSVYGAYTELYAALSPEVKAGDYVIPFGHINNNYRSDLQKQVKLCNEGNSECNARKLYDWCDKVVSDYA